MTRSTTDMGGVEHKSPLPVVPPSPTRGKHKSCKTHTCWSNEHLIGDVVVDLHEINDCVKLLKSRVDSLVAFIAQKLDESSKCEACDEESEFEFESSSSEGPDSAA